MTALQLFLTAKVAAAAAPAPAAPKGITAPPAPGGGMGGGGMGRSMGRGFMHSPVARLNAAQMRNSPGSMGTKGIGLYTPRLQGVNPMNIGPKSLQTGGAQ